MTTQMSKTASTTIEFNKCPTFNVDSIPLSLLRSLCHSALSSRQHFQGIGTMTAKVSFLRWMT